MRLTVTVTMPGALDGSMATTVTMYATMSSSPSSPSSTASWCRDRRRYRYRFGDCGRCRTYVTLRIRIGVGAGASQLEVPAPSSGSIGDSSMSNLAWSPVSQDCRATGRVGVRRPIRSNGIVLVHRYGSTSSNSGTVLARVLASTGLSVTRAPSARQDRQCR